MQEKIWLTIKLIVHHSKKMISQGCLERVFRTVANTVNLWIFFSCIYYVHTLHKASFTMLHVGLGLFPRTSCIDWFTLMISFINNSTYVRCF